MGEVGVVAKHPRNRPKKKKDPAKVAAKKARRAERQAREAAEKARALRRRRIKLAGIGAVIVFVVGIAGFGAFQVFFPGELEGVERPASQGRGHSALGRYGTPTPTSGAHSASSPRCGILAQQLPAELAVHALEHGAVVIWYRPDLDEQVVTDLRRIVGDFDDRVILSPNAELVRPVVATAWNRLKAYPGPVDEIADFIETYRGRGPERIPCPM